MAKAVSKDKKVEKKTEVKTDAKSKSAKVAKETKPVEEKQPVSYRVYHVSYQKDKNMWSVKFEKGEKALKLFKTQKEAIKFAEEKTKNKDGNKVKVHSLKGKIRKA